MKCGLLGRKLGHSYSPAIHKHLGGYSYTLFEKEPEELEDFLRHGNWDGLNVTIPYKQSVIPYLDALTPVAKQVGAVNTIVHQNGKLIGHNTDHFGFQTMLDQSNLHITGKKCLVLGSGGASKVVQSVLQQQGAQVIVISRTGENNYGNLELHTDAAILVNTTPVGMYPDTGISPLSLEHFPQLEGVLDLIYNPARTKLLLDAEQRGLVTMNGLTMLVAQATEAAQWFTNNIVSDESIQRICHRMQQQTENIVLVGMPGCGKSTIGQLIAERTGRTFVDTDAEIVKLASKTIPKILAEDGEEIFRTWESKVIAEWGKQSGLVIATGGGCVSKDVNYRLLRQNGRIFWIKRDIHLLSIEGRPLSVNLQDLYEKRKHLYHRFADHIVENHATPEAIAEQICNWR